MEDPRLPDADRDTKPGRQGIYMQGGGRGWRTGAKQTAKHKACRMGRVTEESKIGKGQGARDWEGREGC